MENLICVKSLCEHHINKLIFEKKIILPNIYQIMIDRQIMNGWNKMF